MAFVIAVAQRKGGAGKSTIAANLAAAYAEEGARVALLDIDPQRSLARWDEVRGRSAKARPLHFEAPTGWRLSATLERLKARLCADILARTGGDEFIVVLPNTDAASAHSMLARLHEASPARWSAGVVEWQHGDSLTDTLHQADQALYLAKTRP